jgi:hypothetical protein
MKFQFLSNQFYCVYPTANYLQAVFNSEISLLEMAKILSNHRLFLGGTKPNLKPFFKKEKRRFLNKIWPYKHDCTIIWKDNLQQTISKI